MDLSNVPTEDLHALAAGDMSKVSEPTLRYLSGQPQQPVAMAPDVSPAKVAAQTVGKNLLGMGEIAGSSVANIPYAAAHTLTDLYHRVTGKGYQPDPRLVSALHVGTGQAGQEFGSSSAEQLERLSDRLRVGNALSSAAGATDTAAKNFEQNHPTLAHTVIPAAADVAMLAGARGVPGAVADAARSTGEGIAGARALMGGEGFDVAEEPTATDVGLKAPNNPPLASHQHIGNVIAANEAGLPPGGELSQQSVEAATGAPSEVYDRAAKALPSGPLDKAARARIETAGDPQGGRVSKGSPQAQKHIEDLRQQLLAPKNAQGNDWTGQNWINELKGLRQDGYANIGSDDVSNQQLGRAQLEMARAVEDHIGRNIPENADVDLPQFQAARTAYAKNRAVQGALKGGNIDMPALARIYRSDPDLMTGGLQTLAKFADENPELVRLSNRFAPDIGLSDIDVTRPATFLKPLQNAAARIANAQRNAQGEEAASRAFPARSPSQFAPIDRTPQAPPGMTAETPERLVAPQQAGGIPLADVLVARPGESLATTEALPKRPSPAQQANAARVRAANIERLASALPLRRGAAFAEGPIGSPSPAQRANAANRLRSIAARIRDDSGEGGYSMAARGSGEGYARGGAIHPRLKDLRDRIIAGRSRYDKGGAVDESSVPLPGAQWATLDNSTLNAEQQNSYQTWLNQMEHAVGHDLPVDDYDMQGAFLSGVAPSANNHFSDEFKKPNHMTFSTDSRYSGHGYTGGRWAKGANGDWSFYASPDNLRFHSPAELLSYFQTVEPDSTLYLPGDQTPFYQPKTKRMASGR
jgi:hypothetical protein